MLKRSRSKSLSSVECIDTSSRRDLLLPGDSSDPKFNLRRSATATKVLKAHDGIVKQSAFSPDGCFLALASDDKTVSIWSNEEGKYQLFFRLEEHVESVECVCYSSDGALLASGGLDSITYIYSTEDDYSVSRVLQEHNGGVTCVQFSQCGNFLASGSADSTVIIFTTHNFAATKILTGHAMGVTSLCFSPTDVNYIATASNDHTVKIWDLSGDTHQTLTSHTSNVYCVDFSPCGNFLASCGRDKVIKIWSTELKDCIYVAHNLTNHEECVTSVKYSPDGLFLASGGSFDKSLRLWSTSTNEEVLTIRGHFITDVNFSPDSKSLVSCCWERTARAVSIVMFGQGMGFEELLHGLRVKNCKVVERAITLMAESSNTDLFFWFEYIEKMSPTPGPDATMVFKSFWQVMDNAHLKESQSPEYEMVSLLLQLSVRDFIADIKQYRPNVLSELIQHFKHNKRHLEKLADTFMMRVLIKELAKEGVMNIYHAEVVLCFALLACFSRITYKCKFSESWEDVMSSLLNRIFAIATVSLAVLFFLREVAQLTAMAKLRLAKLHIYNKWEQLDLLASLWPILTLWVYRKYGPGLHYDHIASIGALLMWLKTISMVKALNKRVATFVLMLSSIFGDLVSFLFVLMSVILMFGHCLFLILGKESLDYDEDGVEGEGQNFATIPFTARTLWSIVLGNYETSDFPDLFTTIVSLLYTFIVVIVMLNVLIAIVGDSYDNAMSRSDELFWRARLELVAEVSVTFKAILLTEEKWEEFARLRGERWTKLRNTIFDRNQFNKMGILLRLLGAPFLLVLVVLGELYMIFMVTPAQLMMKKKRLKRMKKLAALKRKLGGDVDIVHDHEFDLKLAEQRVKNQVWNGRVLDIVARVQENTKEEIEKSERVLSEKLRIQEEQQSVVHANQQQAITEMRLEIRRLTSLVEQNFDTKRNSNLPSPNVGRMPRRSSKERLYR